MFFGYSNQKINKLATPRYLYSYLFKNSFNLVGFNSLNHHGSLYKHSSSGDYFSLNYIDITQTNLYKFKSFLSDECLDVSLPSNKFQRIVHNAYFSIDSFVTSFNSYHLFLISRILLVLFLV